MSGRTYMVLRRYHLIRKFDVDAAANWDFILSNALNQVGHKKNKSEAFFEVFHVGAYALLKEKNQKQGENSIITKAHSYLRDVREMKAEKEVFDELLHELSFDEFVDWAEEVGFDWNSFLEEKKSKNQSKSNWADRARFWLIQKLGDGEPHHTNQIKSDAIEDGIISDSTPESFRKDWDKLRHLASHDGFTTNEKGIWQKT